MLDLQPDLQGEMDIVQ